MYEYATSLWSATQHFEPKFALALYLSTDSHLFFLSEFPHVRCVLVSSPNWAARRAASYPINDIKVAPPRVLKCIKEEDSSPPRRRRLVGFIHPYASRVVFCLLAANEQLIPHSLQAAADPGLPQICVVIFEVELNTRSATKRSIKGQMPNSRVVGAGTEESFVSL